MKDELNEVRKQTAELDIMHWLYGAVQGLTPTGKGVLVRRVSEGTPFVLPEEVAVEVLCLSPSCDVLRTGMFSHGSLAWFKQEMEKGAHKSGFNELWVCVSDELWNSALICLGLPDLEAQAEWKKERPAVAVLA